VELADWTVGRCGSFRHSSKVNKHFLLGLVVLVVKIQVVFLCAMMLCNLTWGYCCLIAVCLEDGLVDSSKILVLSAKLQNGPISENHTLLHTLEGRFFFTSILDLIYYWKMPV